MALNSLINILIVSLGFLWIYLDTLVVYRLVSGQSRRCSLSSISNIHYIIKHHLKYSRYHLKYSRYCTSRKAKHLNINILKISWLSQITLRIIIHCCCFPSFFFFVCYMSKRSLGSGRPRYFRTSSGPFKFPISCHEGRAWVTTSDGEFTRPEVK